MGKRSFEYMQGRDVKIEGRKLGEVRGKFYYRQIYGSRHFLRQPLAIAYLIESLKQAGEMGARVAVVTDRETGVTYRATFETIRAHGVRVSRGYGEQIALPLEFWERLQPLKQNDTSPLQPAGTPKVLA